MVKGYMYGGPKSQIIPFYFQECKQFISKVKELRHQTILKKHFAKYGQLWQKTRGGHSNNLGGCSKVDYSNKCIMPVPDITVRTQAITATATDTTPATTATTSAGTETTTTATTTMFSKKWVRSLSSTPLTEAKIYLLVHGPNFAVAPRIPLMGVHHCGRTGLPEPRSPQYRRIES